MNQHNVELMLECKKLPGIRDCCRFNGRGMESRLLRSEPSVSLVRDGQVRIRGTTPRFLRTSCVNDKIDVFGKAESGGIPAPPWRGPPFQANYEGKRTCETDASPQLWFVAFARELIFCLSCNILAACREQYAIRWTVRA
jgi:hypothetical protein